jgi:MFS family permease
MAALVLKPANWLYQEFGLQSVYEVGLDAWLIIASRCLRMLAYGTNALVLVLFFSELGFSDFYIGLFMTLTLLGDVAICALTAMVADQVGRRKTLLGGSILMVFTGAIFSYFENYWILLFAAIIGVVSAAGNDLGPFRAIEESTLSHLTTPKTRSDVLAWYVTIASVGSAAGTELCGRIVDGLTEIDGWTRVDAYHAIFWVYTAMGLLNVAFALLMSEKCELAREPSTPESKAEEEGVLLDETEDHDEPSHPKKDTYHRSTAPSKPPAKKGRFSSISRGTLSTMYRLWTLLISDSLADGMVAYSLTVYYMDQKFSPSTSTLGDITSVSYFVASVSTVFAGPLAKRLGLINTMVFTHLPSSAAVALFPLPSGMWMTFALFLVRAGLNNMDQAPRSAFIAAVVKPEERTAVMGITSMVRTLASAAGPSVTGWLAGSDRFWIAFVVAGCLRIGYDLGLWALFVNMKLYQHENGELGTEPEQVDEGKRTQGEQDEFDLSDLTESSSDAEDAKSKPPR